MTPMVSIEIAIVPYTVYGWDITGSVANRIRCGRLFFFLSLDCFQKLTCLKREICAQTNWGLKTMFIEDFAVNLVINKKRRHKTLITDQHCVKGEMWKPTFHSILHTHHTRSLNSLWKRQNFQNVYFPSCCEIIWQSHLIIMLINESGYPAKCGQSENKYHTYLKSFWTKPVRTINHLYKVKGCG